MNKAIPLIGLLAFALALSGCTSEPAQSAAVYTYVCPDGSMVDSPALCQAVECIDCDQYCEDYCAGIQSGNGLTAADVQAEIEAANYCEVKDDCVETNTKCPIGCYNLVNAAELDRINDLVGEFKQTCFQTCATLDDFDCVEGRCEPILPGVG